MPPLGQHPLLSIFIEAYTIVKIQYTSACHWIQNQASGIVCESGKNYLCALLHIISRYVSPEDKKASFKYQFIDLAYFFYANRYFLGKNPSKNQHVGYVRGYADVTPMSSLYTITPAHLH